MGPGESSLSSIIAGNGAGPGGSSTGAQITVHSKPDYIHIHIAIQGKSPNGGNGRFKALYRVYCTA
jgi:hypothetical protein